MKTIRLVYPDSVSGGLKEYYFGSLLMSHIIPENGDQPMVRVDIPAPDDDDRGIRDGIYALDDVLAGIDDAKLKIGESDPDRIITIGGNCLVSLAPFDYLHGRYGEVGIIWIDAHPDVSSPQDGYPYAHSMVLSTLLGRGDKHLAGRMDNPSFRPDQLLYLGLQGLLDYQRETLDNLGVDYRTQTESFISPDEIRAFAGRFRHILVHLDIDVLDERRFHSTYFANPELVGDGSGGGRMTIDELGEFLEVIQDSSEVVGLTVAEYLPFDEYRLHRMFERVRIFRD